MFQICVHCKAAPGYPHAASCPGPLYSVPRARPVADDGDPGDDEPIAVLSPGTVVRCNYRGAHHRGIVLADTDPRAWAGSIAFPSATPDPAAVASYVGKLRARGEDNRGRTAVDWQTFETGRRVYWDHTRELVPATMIIALRPIPTSSPLACLSDPRPRPIAVEFTDGAHWRGAPVDAADVCPALVWPASAWEVAP